MRVEEKGSLTLDKVQRWVLRDVLKRALDEAQTRRRYNGDDPPQDVKQRATWERNVRGWESRIATIQELLAMTNGDEA
jgi:hypothetical protein